MIVDSVEIADVERVSKTRRADTELVQDSGGRVATAFVVLDQGPLGAVVGRAIVGQSVVGYTPPAPQSTIAIGSLGLPIFRGYVAKVSTRVENGIHRYELDCVDYTLLLDTVMIQSETYASKTDEFILDDLRAKYLPELDMNDVVSVDTLDSLELSDVSFREAIERIVERTGAEWFLDYDKHLQYFPAGHKVAPFDIDERSETYFPLSEGLRYDEDFSNPANRVIVVGIGSETTSAVMSVNPSAGSDDGATLRQQAAYPPDAGASTTNTTDTATGPTRSFLGGQYFVGVGLIRFDTSAIPDDAEIISATLKLWVNSMTFADSGELRGEYYNAASWPIDNSDYTSTVSDNAIDAQPLFAFTTGQYNSLPLKDVGTNISLTGYTGLRLHVRTAAAPTGNNGLVYQTFEGANKPILEIAYQITSAGAGATEDDAASQALYGRVFERTLIDRQILTDAEASLMAQVELAKYSTPRKSGSLKILADGLAIGQLVNIALPSIGVSDGFLIRRLVWRWITDDVTEYTLDFGDFRPDLITLLRKNARSLQ